jgi:2-C-methyl-D-erythritol 4-phosphate cytidylyltransferase
MRTVAVVLAGGSGHRFGAAGPKQLCILAGRSLIEHCVLAFSEAQAVDEVLVVAAAEITAQVRQQVTGYAKLTAVIGAGTTRTDSTRHAINWLAATAGRSADHDFKVLFHDAARPLIDQRTIADCVAALDRWQAVGVVVPSSDTIVEIGDGRIQRVLSRESLARCQTPQGFWLSVISRAYQLGDADPGFAGTPATDDCGVVLRYLPEVAVGFVPGSEQNLKITYPADLAVAQALLDAGEQMS